tara:strand:- start:247 stop:399 length:153 start_codon:yes stop_codon:yes gene_type:complete
LKKAIKMKNNIFDFSDLSPEVRDLLIKKLKQDEKLNQKNSNSTKVKQKKK